VKMGIRFRVPDTGFIFVLKRTKSLNSKSLKYGKLTSVLDSQLDSTTKSHSKKLF